MNAWQQCSFLIVGAGIAGLATARTLQHCGAQVEIVERNPASGAEGTGIFLPGNAVRALHRLGLGTQVARRAVQIDRQRVADHRGRLLLDSPTAELLDGVGTCLALPRAVLHQVLLAGADPVPIRWGQTVQAVIALHGAAAGLQRATAPSGRPVRPPLRRRPTGTGTGVDGAARARDVVPDHPVRPPAGVLLLRRPRTDWVLRQTRRRDKIRAIPAAVRNVVLKRAGNRIFHANHRPLREQP